MQPKLIIPVGKLAISQFIEVKKLTDVIGKIHPYKINNEQIDLIPLPHPSGASTWHITEPGKTLLQDALKLIQNHAIWKEQVPK